MESTQKGHKPMMKQSSNCVSSLPFGHINHTHSSLKLSLYSLLAVQSVCQDFHEPVGTVTKGYSHHLTQSSSVSSAVLFRVLHQQRLQVPEFSFLECNCYFEMHWQWQCWQAWNQWHCHFSILLVLIFMMGLWYSIMHTHMHSHTHVHTQKHTQRHTRTFKHYK